MCWGPNNRIAPSPTALAFEGNQTNGLTGRETATLNDGYYNPQIVLTTCLNVLPLCFCLIAVY